MRYAMVRIALGPRIADKLVPQQVKIARPPPPVDAKPKETIVRRNIVVRAKRG
jgi:hypothetical protein